MNKKGFTVVELMTTFTLITVISILLIKLTITLKEVYINGDIKTALLTKQGNMTDKIYKDLEENKLNSLTSCGTNCINFEYETNTKMLKINNNILTYDNYSIKLGNGGYFGTVEISNYDSDIGYNFNLNIPIYHKLVKGNYGININYQSESLNYDESILFDIVDNNIYKEEILNGADPVIKENLIPVVMENNGTVKKANLSKKWYSYEDKKWANAVILKEKYTNNKIYDLSGHGNDATIYGATITNEGLKFDGIDDYAKVNELNFNNTTEFTIEFKAKVTSSSDIAILFESSGNYNSNFGSFYIDTMEFGKNNLLFGLKGNDNNLKITDNNVVNSKEFKTYTITFNSKNNYDTYVNIYINGVKQNLTTPTLNGNLLNGDLSDYFFKNFPFFIGSRNGNSYFTSMTLQNLKIYTKELSEKQVKNNYNNNIETDKLILMYDLIDNENKKSAIITNPEIKQYYVWIPKYAYKLWNVDSNNTENKEKPIEITFGSKARTTGTNNGDTYIHPAFTNFNTNGIWVGKFEISYDEETYTDKTKFLTTNPNYASATDSSKLLVKPNVRSLTYKNVSSLYTLLKNTNETLNSHMMTNMEWGATAYLTYSKYGRCNSNSCTEVTINNVNTGYYGSSAVFSGQWEYSAAITGCAADTVSASVQSNKNECLNKYNSSKGYLASTTGNITGIYDMSGGSWEYVMGVIKDSSGNLYSGRNSTSNSGFKGLYGDTGGSNTTGLDFPNTKYYDAYVRNDAIGTDNWYIYTSGKLGDATKEVANTKTSSTNDRGLWFNDCAYFATPTYPFFIRGGGWSNGSGAGVFSFHRAYGHAVSNSSARLVLAF